MTKIGEEFGVDGYVLKDCGVGGCEGSVGGCDGGIMDWGGAAGRRGVVGVVWQVLALILRADFLAMVTVSVKKAQ